jgi:hypothetical protein
VKNPKKEVSQKSQETDLIYEKAPVIEILSAIKPGLASKDIVESMKNFYFSMSGAIFIR